MDCGVWSDGGKSDSVIDCPAAIITARSMQFSSSLTLLGQWYAQSMFIAAGDIDVIFLFLSAECFCRKNFASCGMSRRLWRRGGIFIVNTLRW